MKSFRADLILWGLFQGFVAYLVLAWIAPQWQGNPQALSAIGLLGAAMSATVFGLVRGTRPGTPPVGFLVVSSLLPLVAVLGGDTLHYGRPYFAGPLTLGFIMLWTILLLPCGLAGMLLFSRRHG